MSTGSRFLWPEIRKNEKLVAQKLEFQHRSLWLALGVGRVGLWPAQSRPTSMILL